MMRDQLCAFLGIGLGVLFGSVLTAEMGPTLGIAVGGLALAIGLPFLARHDRRAEQDGRPQRVWIVSGEPVKKGMILQAGGKPGNTVKGSVADPKLTAKPIINPSW